MRVFISRFVINFFFSLPVAIVSISADDVTSRDEKPRVRVVESEENQETKERVVLVTIQSHSQVRSESVPISKDNSAF